MRETRSAKIRAILMAAFIGALALPGQARQLCAGGQYIKDGDGNLVGCVFEAKAPTFWLSLEQELMCNGAVIFPIEESGTPASWVCLEPGVAYPVQQGDWNDLYRGVCTVPPDGLSGWWPLNELAGSGHAESPLGSALRGTHRNGPMAAPGHVRGGLQMDGADDYVEIADHSALDFGTSANGDFTLAAWVKLGPNDIVGGVRTMIDKRQIAPYRGYSFFLYNGRPGVQLADGGANGGYTNYFATPAVPADGKWHLVAVSVSRANGATFFIDGDSVGTFSVSQRTGSLENSSPLRIASQSFFVSSLFQGGIDEVAIFRRALPEPEIRTLVNAGAVGMCKP